MSLVLTAICGISWTLFTFLSWFIGNIDALDAMLVTFVVWFALRYDQNRNGWLALLMGLVAALIVYIIFKHKIGFWIVSALFSFLWGWVLVSIVSALFFHGTNGVAYWVWVALVSVFAGGAHAYAKDRAAIEKLIEEEDRAKGRTRS